MSEFSADWGERMADGVSNLIVGLKNRLPWLKSLDFKVRGMARRGAARAARTYSSMSWARVLLLNSALLSLLFTLDSMTGHLAGFTIIYMLPIWLAARLSGAGAGIIAMLLVGTLMTITEAGGPLPSRDEALLSFAIRWIALGGFLISVLHVETALKSAVQQATHDPLTGLVNRAAIEVYANAALARCNAENQIHVGVIDCDDFKALNDANGHAFGDHALKVLARRLEAVVKDKGKIGRMGGDEFVVLFEGLSRKDAKQVLTRAEAAYRRILASLGFSSGLSYGLATCGKDGATFERLCRVADERMYARKRELAARAVVALEAHEPAAHDISAA